MKLGFELNIGSGFQFYPDKKLGSGAFGEIFKGSRVKDKKEIAIKIESSTARIPQILHEAKVLQFLSGGEGIPILYSSFPIGDYNCLIMELLGPNISEVLNFYKNKITIKLIAQIALQMLSRIEFIHSRHYIHRDIKPENFLIGNTNNMNMIYLIDYGLAKRFRDPKSGLHIPYKDGKLLTGTPKFVSIYTHLGIEQSRRDDLESLGYVLIYLIKGGLPWDHCHAKTTSEKFTKLMEKKIFISNEDLCSGLPEEMIDYFKSVRGMQFEEKPDYAMLKGLMMKIIHKEDINNDGNFYLDDLLKLTIRPVNNNINLLLKNSNSKDSIDKIHQKED